MGYVDGMVLYTYDGSSPMQFLDPMGLELTGAPLRPALQPEEKPMSSPEGEFIQNPMTFQFGSHCKCEGTLTIKWSKRYPNPGLGFSGVQMAFDAKLDNASDGPLSWRQTVHSTVDDTAGNAAAAVQAGIGFDTREHGGYNPFGAWPVPDNKLGHSGLPPSAGVRRRIQRRSPPEYESLAKGNRRHQALRHRAPLPRRRCFSP
jgi:hypothetical protein